MIRPIVIKFSEKIIYGFGFGIGMGLSWKSLNREKLKIVSSICKLFLYFSICQIKNIRR